MLLLMKLFKMVKVIDYYLIVTELFVNSYQIVQQKSCHYVFTVDWTMMFTAILNRLCLCYLQNKQNYYYFGVVNEQLMDQRQNSQFASIYIVEFVIDYLNQYHLVYCQFIFVLHLLLIIRVDINFMILLNRYYQLMQQIVLLFVNRCCFHFEVI